jgi:hypothetical protein
MATTIWRAFPWDPGASRGKPFSGSYIPEQSGQGRFDLPRSTGASAWYFAESPAHAVAEKIQDLRNRTLVDEFLFERGHRLALVSARVDGRHVIADLCDARELARRGLAPDRLAYRDRAETQEVAARLYATPELVGFRWWSAFFGEWHTVVLFSDRLPQSALRFDDPEPLKLSSSAVITASDWLGIEIG